jgi:hypothetical protein
MSSQKQQRTSMGFTRDCSGHVIGIQEQQWTLVELPETTKDAIQGSKGLERTLVGLKGDYRIHCQG